MEYIIGTYIFKTKAEAKARYSQILKDWDLYEYIQGDDIHLLNALLDHHPWRSSIVGKSHIVGFRLVPTKYRSRAIEAIRKDGSSAAFPLGRAFENKNPNKLEVFRQRCRKAIAPQIIAFKRRYYELFYSFECEVTGALLQWDEVHIDHVYSMESMIQDWLDTNNNDMSKKSVEDFAEWHSERAELRVVSKSFNLARGRQDE